MKNLLILIATVLSTSFAHADVWEKSCDLFVDRSPTIFTGSFSKSQIQKLESNGFNIKSASLYNDQSPEGLQATFRLMLSVGDATVESSFFSTSTTAQVTLLPQVRGADGKVTMAMSLMAVWNLQGSRAYGSDIYDQAIDRLGKCNSN